MFHILVLEDNADMRELFCTVLSDSGYHCIPAADGLDALEVMDREYIDLIVADIMMPGMDMMISAKGFSVTDQCIGCGKCEARCPLNNVKLVNGKQTWGSNCTHCMACIAGCPSEAIEYGKKTQGKPRYYLGEE